MVSLKEIVVNMCTLTEMARRKTTPLRLALPNHPPTGVATLNINTLNHSNFSQQPGPLLIIRGLSKQ